MHTPNHQICMTNVNCNTSEISISIFMSVMITYLRSYFRLAAVSPNSDQVFDY